MASVSSLLKSSAAAQKKVQQQQDAEIAYEWSQSAKTYGDFQAYQGYLSDQASKTADPTALLTYQKASDSARSAYTSNEIQRQSIDVIEGRSTSTEKYGKLVNLYYSAVANGNNDLAQSLNLQIDNLSVTIQNEATAAQNAAATMAMNGVKSLTKLVDKVKNGTELMKLPDGTIIKPLSMLGDELAANGKTQGDYFGEAYRTINAITGVIADAYKGATTQDAVDAIESKYGGILTGTDKFKTAAGSLTAPEIELAYRSALANNPIYSVTTARNDVTGKTEYQLSKNKVDDFTWVRNDDGTYQAVNTMAKQTSPYQTLDTQITDNGNIVGNSLTASEQGYVKGKDLGQIAGGTGLAERNSALSIKNRLANLGYSATQNADGTLTLLDPSGRQYTATIAPDGSVRYFGDPGQFSSDQAGLYELNIFDGGVKEVNPADTSIFGTQSSFGGLLSKPSDEGTKIINSLAGVTRPMTDLVGPGARITNLGNDFSGNNVPVFGSAIQGTSGILATAESTRTAQIRSQQQQTPQLQPAQAFNLNQTPVGNGVNRSIEIARPTPAPAISLAPPIQTPTISGVTQAKPQQGLTVAAPQSQPTLRVQ